MRARCWRRGLVAFVHLAGGRCTLIGAVGVFHPRLFRGGASGFELGLEITLCVGPRGLSQRAHNNQPKDDFSCKFRDSHDGPHFEWFEYVLVWGGAEWVQRLPGFQLMSYRVSATDGWGIARGLISEPSDCTNKTVPLG